MKTESIQTILIFVILFALISCDKDCIKPNEIKGEWTWIKSVGGFGGWTLTPESEGITRHLIIDDFWYKEFINDSLVFKSQYDLQIRSETIYGTNTYIQFTYELDPWWECAYKLSEDELELYDMCIDCYIHTYKRK